MQAPRLGVLQPMPFRRFPQTQLRATANPFDVRHDGALHIRAAFQIRIQTARGFAFAVKRRQRSRIRQEIPKVLLPVVSGLLLQRKRALL